MTRLGPGLAVAAALLYLLLVTPQLDRPLMYDDANFALAARAVAESGLPYGNQGWMSERGDFSQREQWALWHPPLYVYEIGLLSRLGGWSAPVLRLAGVVGGLLSGLLSYRLAAELTHGPPLMRRLAGGVAAVLVFVCPLVVQSTLVVDIDFAVLLPLTLLFLLLYLRLEGTPRWPLLIPLFGLLLWAKMTNPLPLLAAAICWQALRGHVVRAGLHVAGIGLGGAALFGLSWLLVGRLLGFPLDMPFGVNTVQWQDSAEVARRAYTSPGAFLEGLQPTLLWLGPGLVALGLIGVCVRTAQLAGCWRIRGADLLIGVFIALVLGYVNKSAGWFPKYQVALAPLLAILAAPPVAYAVCARPRLGIAIVTLAAIASGLVELRLVRDSWALERTYAIDPAAAAWLLAIVLGGLLLASLGTVIGRTAPASRLAGPAAAVALAGLAIGWSLGTDLVQLGAAYQTDYWYGTSGTLEAAAWVDSHLQPGQTYVAAKEVAIRATDQRYVDQDNIVYFVSIGRGFSGSWAGEPLHAMVVWQREPYVADLFARAAAAAGFLPTAQFGDYVVYEPAGSGS